jgi:hypothetical protein
MHAPHMQQPCSASSLYQGHSHACAVLQKVPIQAACAGLVDVQMHPIISIFACVPVVVHESVLNLHAFRSTQTHGWCIDRMRTQQ